jgi:hypothetical protein
MLVAGVGAVSARPVTVTGWNLESGDEKTAHPTNFIESQQGRELWGFCGGVEKWHGDLLHAAAEGASLGQYGGSLGRRADGIHETVALFTTCLHENNQNCGDA